MDIRPGQQSPIYGPPDDSPEQLPDLLQEQLIMQMNHELRTPLTVILGFLELLRDQKERLDADTQAALLNQAICACEELQSLISSILALLEMDKSTNSPKSKRSPAKEEFTLNRQISPSEALPGVPLVQATTGGVETTSQVASPEDLSLIASLRRGDEDAMMSLLQRYHSSMVRLALIHLPDRVEAELVVKETWMAILRNLDQLQAHNSLKIAIHSILINRIRLRQRRVGNSLPSARLAEAAHTREADHQRFFQMGHPHAGGWAVPPRRWQVPPDPCLSQELRALIERAIERLPPDQCEVIILCDIEGWSSGEVSTLLGLSENHQRDLLHRARTFVRQVIDEYFDDMAALHSES